MYFVGIDIGSYFIKAVLIDETGKLLFQTDSDSGPFYDVAAAECLNRLLTPLGIGIGEIEYAVLTGIGNKLVAGKLGFAKEDLVTDITCQARAASWMFPECRTVIDVGGASSKVVGLDNYGCSRAFLYNEKCAAGSGRFMQIIANMLEIDVSDIGKVSLEGTSPISFTTGCAVFAESDVITKIGEGETAANILAGMNIAIASKILTLMKRVSYVPKCVMTGGASRNIGLVAAMENLLNDKVLVPEQPEYSCAFGAALSAIKKSGRSLPNG